MTFSFGKSLKVPYIECCIFNCGDKGSHLQDKTLRAPQPSPGYAGNHREHTVWPVLHLRQKIRGVLWVGRELHSGGKKAVVRSL